MNAAQILTIAIAVGFPVSMLIYSNSRITEAKETLREPVRRADIPKTCTMGRRFSAFESATHSWRHRVIDCLITLKWLGPVVMRAPSLRSDISRLCSTGH